MSNTKKKPVSRNMNLVNAKVNASKNRSTSSNKTSSNEKSGKKVSDVYSHIKSDPVEFKQMPNPDMDKLDLTASLRGKATTADEKALAPSRQIMQNRENIDFDSSTDRGIKSLYTGKRQEEYTDSGMNYRDANSKLIKGSQVDEGELSSVVRKSPERPYVKGSKDSMYAGEKLYLDKAAKMVAKHPSQQRMENMVNKVATYNMPNAKAAQKKYYK